MIEPIKSIGNYQLGQTLGVGTFGKVKLGTHHTTEEVVAVKILEKEKIKEQADLERVAREINILKQLRHQHIIQLYEIVETEKSLYLIMEYTPGGELFDYITKMARIPEREAAQFFLQILSGVDYLHSVNVMHRDLKPENLLLDENKQIKIVDFGLSNSYKDGQLLRTACGSPCYAAPEVIAGKGYMGSQADIWSCGVVLFAMICGRLPFEDPNTGNLYKKIMNAEYTIPSHVTPLAANLIQGILNTDPQKRFTIDQIQQHYWISTNLTEIKIPRGVYIGVDEIPINNKILEQLPKYNFKIDYARQCILNNRHNQVTTIYYLLLKKYEKDPQYRQELDKQSQRMSQRNMNRFPQSVRNSAINHSANQRDSMKPQLQQNISIKTDVEQLENIKEINNNKDINNNNKEIIQANSKESNKDANRDVNKDTNRDNYKDLNNRDANNRDTNIRDNNVRDTNIRDANNRDASKDPKEIILNQEIKNDIQSISQTFNNNLKKEDVIPEVVYVKKDKSLSKIIEQRESSDQKNTSNQMFFDSQSETEKENNVISGRPSFKEERQAPPIPQQIEIMTRVEVKEIRTRQLSQSVEKKPETLFPTAQQIIEKANRFKQLALQEPDRDKSPFQQKKVLTNKNMLLQSARMRQISPTYTQVKSHEGPYNLNQLFYIEPGLMIQKLRIYLIQKDFDIIWIKKHEIRVQKQDLQLEIYINQIVDGIYIMKCVKIAGDEDLFHKIYNQIITQQ